MKRIALVEDNSDNRLLVCAILEDQHEIDEYESGLEALAGIRHNLPDMVLLDISLPRMDGTEVLREIRADARLSNLPVVALTAHAMAGDRERLAFHETVAHRSQNRANWCIIPKPSALKRGSPVTPAGGSTRGASSRHPRIYDERLTDIGPLQKWRSGRNAHRSDR